ncbi:hypothetical protein LZL87_003057 [Fusarium oxysporum]|uniref:Uncharacterized protein n=1 Tax=Fusarium oxysporum f. sp. rapae TaxID=485398 RepID=A0A8J5P7R0_FUSOX|nr:hypothetical protein Forpe1208_v008177 [Fusarium oxysporum f. sp. rapae]KAI7769567.1 hypothetical protein LZL87_003057 [Fusarium oxysporum]
MSSDPVEDPRKSEDYELISNGDVGSDTDQALDNGRKAMKETISEDTEKPESPQENLSEVTQPLPEHVSGNHKTDKPGESQDTHDDSPGNNEHEKPANAEEPKDDEAEKATTGDDKSEEVENDEVTDTTKEVELEWAKLLLDDDYDS